MREPAPEGGAPTVQIPALVEFPEAGSVRLLAPIVDATPDKVRVGAELILAWSSAANAQLPAFRLAD